MNQNYVTGYMVCVNLNNQNDQCSQHYLRKAFFLNVCLVCNFMSCVAKDKVYFIQKL